MSNVKFENLREVATEATGQTKLTKYLVSDGFGIQRAGRSNDSKAGETFKRDVRRVSYSSAYAFRVSQTCFRLLSIHADFAGTVAELACEYGATLTQTGRNSYNLTGESAGEIVASLELTVRTRAASNKPLSQSVPSDFVPAYTFEKRFDNETRDGLNLCFLLGKSGVSYDILERVALRDVRLTPYRAAFRYLRHSLSESGLQEGVCRLISHGSHGNLEQSFGTVTNSATLFNGLVLETIRTLALCDYEFASNWNLQKDGTVTRKNLVSRYNRVTLKNEKRRELLGELISHLNELRATFDTSRYGASGTLGNDLQPVLITMQKRIDATQARIERDAKRAKSLKDALSHIAQTCLEQYNNAAKVERKRKAKVASKRYRDGKRGVSITETLPVSLTVSDAQVAQATAQANQNWLEGERARASCGMARTRLNGKASELRDALDSLKVLASDVQAERLTVETLSDRDELLQLASVQIDAARLSGFSVMDKARDVASGSNKGAMQATAKEVTRETKEARTVFLEVASRLSLKSQAERNVSDVIAVHSVKSL